MEFLFEVCYVIILEVFGFSVVVGVDLFISFVRDGICSLGFFDSLVVYSVVIGGKSFMFFFAIVVVDEYFKEKCLEILGGDDFLIYW